MDTKRAQEIVNSPKMVNVTYNGTEIYIERVNDSNETAYIHPVNQPTSAEEVPLAYLHEQIKF